MVPEYYFLCLDAIHYGLMPILNNAEAVQRIANNLSEKLSQQSPSSPYCNQLNKSLDHQEEMKLKLVKGIKVMYTLALGSNQFMAKMLRFFRLHIELLLQWGNYNEKVLPN